MPLPGRTEAALGAGGALVGAGEEAGVSDEEPQADSEKRRTANSTMKTAFFIKNSLKFFDAKEDGSHRMIPYYFIASAR
jgi:hypothetical protein